MSNFDKLCEKLAALPYDEKVEMINDISAEIIPALADITQDGMGAVSAYTDFILCAVAADGKLAKEEYQLIKPLFDAAAEKDVSYDEALAIFKSSGYDNPAEYKKTVDLMVDLVGTVSDELKDSIITLCILICAVDGEISEEEKKWIVQLADDNFGATVMDEIYDILDEAKVFMLATTDADQPKMRVLGFKCMVEDRIFFAVGTFKEVYAQLQKNPKCEILASVGMSFLRWDGKAVFYEDPRFMEAAEMAMPQVVQMYKNMGATLAFFTIEDGTAEIVGADNSKKKLF